MSPQSSSVKEQIEGKNSNNKVERNRELECRGRIDNGL